MLTLPPNVSCNLFTKGFTFLELITSISVTSILAAIAIPNFNDFIIKMRVDNEISQLHRLLLITRNAAINSGHKVILCPLDKNSQCTDQWHEELSVFIDINDNKKLDANEKIINIRAKINSKDKLLYGKSRNKITFSPTGQLSGLANGTFRYCPLKNKKNARGIVIARSGRVYQSRDYNKTGIDKTSGNKVLNCK